jgi:hypothetical protein
MKKLLILAAVTASIMTLIVPRANALPAVASFTVSANLASACRIKTGFDNLTINVGSYTAFQSGDLVSSAVNIDFECTRTLGSITGVFDDDAGTDTLSSAAAAQPTGAGVLSNGLNYTLATAASSVAAPTVATSVSIGDAMIRRFAVTATIPELQAGTCANANCNGGTQARTLTLNF